MGQKAITAEELPLLLFDGFDTKGNFGAMFHSMGTSIINDNLSGGADFRKLKDNPVEQAAWLEAFGDFSFSKTPSPEVVQECRARFYDMRVARPDLFQPQVEALRAAGGPAKVLLEFCERFHVIHCSQAAMPTEGDEEFGGAVEE